MDEKQLALNLLKKGHSKKYVANFLKKNRTTIYRWEKNCTQKKDSNKRGRQKLIPDWALTTFTNEIASKKIVIKSYQEATIWFSKTLNTEISYHVVRNTVKSLNIKFKT